MPPGGIRTHNPSKRATVDQRLRPHGHWDQRFYLLIHVYFSLISTTYPPSLPSSFEHSIILVMGSHHTVTLWFISSLFCRLGPAPKIFLNMLFSNILNPSHKIYIRHGAYNNKILNFCHFYLPTDAWGTVYTTTKSWTSITFIYQQLHEAQCIQLKILNLCFSLNATD
jgi:hypothetical protein